MPKSLNIELQRQPRNLTIAAFLAGLIVGFGGPGHVDIHGQLGEYFPGRTLPCRPLLLLTAIDLYSVLPND